MKTLLFYRVSKRNGNIQKPELPMKIFYQKYKALSRAGKEIFENNRVHKTDKNICAGDDKIGFAF
ncbi:MAG: hypothetical protein ACI4EA_11815 [Candidatus Ornithomonoglobus sp.]